MSDASYHEASEGKWLSREPFFTQLCETIAKYRCGQSLKKVCREKKVNVVCVHRAVPKFPSMNNYLFWQVPGDTATLFLRTLKIAGVEGTGNTSEAVRMDLIEMRDKLRDLDTDKDGLFEATENNTKPSVPTTSPNMASSLDPKDAFDDLVMNENTLQAEKVLRRAMLAAEGLIDPNIFGRWCEVISLGT